MAVSHDHETMLDEDDLNELDRAILDYLASDGRATPSLIQRALQERGVSTGVRQNISARLRRLREHGHVQNVHDSGVYAFVTDPRARGKTTVQEDEAVRGSPDDVQPEETDDDLRDLAATLDLPGQSEAKLEARREAVVASLAYLRAHETARPSELKDEVFASHRGYHESSNAWWKRTVSKAFSQLRDRGVVELAEKHTGTWRWVGSDE